MHKQKVNDYKQNTAPNGDLNGLADAVQLHKIGGEYKRPYHVKRQDNNDAPKRTFDTKIDDERRCSYCKKGPTYNRQHSLAVLGELCHFWVCVVNVHSNHSLPPWFQFRQPAKADTFFLQKRGPVSFLK